MEIGQGNRVPIEQLFERYLEDNSYYQMNKQRFVDALSCVNRWLAEPCVSADDRAWCQDMRKSLESAKAPLGFPGGTATDLA